MQLLERALQKRTRALLRVVDSPALRAHVDALTDQQDAMCLERDHIPPRTFPATITPATRLCVGACARCRCVWARLEDQKSSLCDICQAVDQITGAWAAQMPTKEVKSTKKKRRKKKKRPLHPAPTHADLHQLMSEQPRLRQQILGQSSLTQSHSTQRRAWQSPFEDPYLRWPDCRWVRGGTVCIVFV